MRCLAESNRLERFCRPIPNRSDKAPCCQILCKGSVFISIHQIFAVLFFFILSYAFIFILSFHPFLSVIHSQASLPYVFKSAALASAAYVALLCRLQCGDETYCRINQGCNNDGYYKDVLKHSASLYRYFKG